MDRSLLVAALLREQTGGQFPVQRKKYGPQLTSSSRSPPAKGWLAVVSHTEVLRARKDSIVTIQEFIHPVLQSHTIPNTNE